MMKIQCPSCQHAGTVPDEKVPVAGVTVTCPKCQTKFHLSLPAKPIPPSDFFCPKCGTSQPRSDACIKCGIIFSKIKAKKEVESNFKIPSISVTENMKCKDHIYKLGSPKDKIASTISSNAKYYNNDIDQKLKSILLAGEIVVASILMSSFGIKPDSRNRQDIILTNYRLILCNTSLQNNIIHLSIPYHIIEDVKCKSIFWALTIDIKFTHGSTAIKSIIPEHVNEIKNVFFPLLCKFATEEQPDEWYNTYIGILNFDTTISAYDKSEAIKRVKSKFKYIPEKASCAKRLIMNYKPDLNIICELAAINAHLIVDDNAVYTAIATDSIAANIITGVKTKMYPLDTITSIDIRNGLATIELEIVMPGANEISRPATILNKINNENIYFFTPFENSKVIKFANTVLEMSDKKKRSRINYSSNYSSQNNQILDQIKQLADLKNNGIITEEEFHSKKTDLLQRL